MYEESISFSACGNKCDRVYQHHRQQRVEGVCHGKSVHQPVAGVDERNIYHRLKKPG